MPSAYQASRQFLANAVGRIRSGLAASDRRLDEPGPDIKVEPFDAQNVSTPAALIKLGTSIQAARRREANYRSLQENAALAREKTRAEIARLRAEAAYAAGGKERAGTVKTLSRDVGPYKAGTPLSDVNADMAERRLAASGKASDERARRSGRVAAAQAALRDVDARMERDIDLAARRSLLTAEPGLRAVLEAGADADPRDLIRLGIDPAAYRQDNLLPQERGVMVGNARKALFEKYRAKHKLEPYIARFYGPKRAKYQEIIEQGAEGFDSVESGAEGDPNDPLGILGEE